jgi:hypothetical protein
MSNVIDARELAASNAVATCVPSIDALPLTAMSPSHVPLTDTSAGTNQSWPADTPTLIDAPSGDVLRFMPMADAPYATSTSAVTGQMLAAVEYKEVYQDRVVTPPNAAERGS